MSRLYQVTQQIIIILLILGWCGTSGYTLFHVPDKVDMILATWASLITLGIKEYFGAPGPTTNGGHS